MSNGRSLTQGVLGASHVHFQKGKGSKSPAALIHLSTQTQFYQKTSSAALCRRLPFVWQNHFILPMGSRRSFVRQAGAAAGHWRGHRLAHHHRGRRTSQHCAADEQLVLSWVPQLRCRFFQWSHPESAMGFLGFNPNPGGVRSKTRARATSLKGPNPNFASFGEGPIRPTKKSFGYLFFEQFPPCFLRNAGYLGYLLRLAYKVY